MLCGLILLLLSPLTSALQPRDFRVPSVDFTQLSSAADNAHNLKLLTNLQENGIIALQNVPNYSVLRQEYLVTAVACAARAHEQDAAFLLHRQLRDGTNRYTVSLESGGELSNSLVQSQKLLEICPEYVQLHAAFSAVVELAVANVGTALDATQKFHVVAEHGAIAMTARKLLEDSVHLDHFHAYEAPPGLRRLNDDLEINVADMSLELHTDNGLMIAMSAPEYFEVLSNGKVQRKDTQSKDAGLFIQTTSGEIVRPVMNPDELILMLGSGVDDWIRTTPPLRSVLHGMRYPRSISQFDGDEQGSKLLRSWFGKMILLEAHQVMDNTGLTFGQYANQTTRYLAQEEARDEAFGAVACPPQRHLAASDDSCLLKTCSLKSSALESDREFSCQITCNHDSASDAALCQQYCDCNASSSSGTRCWMLCVENFSLEVCPGEQVCNSASTKDTLAMTCVAGTAPPPSTPSAPTTPTSASGNANPSSSTTLTPSGSTASARSTSTSDTTTAASSADTSTKSTAISDAPSSVSATATGSKSVSPATNEGTAALVSKARDRVTGTSASTATLHADEVPSTPASASPSSTSPSSSAASVVFAAIFVNGIASLMAAFLCIE